MKHTCPKCNKSFKEYTLKLGGLICPYCRIILFDPYDEEYELCRARINKSRLRSERNNKLLDGSHIPRLSPGIKAPMPSWIQPPSQDLPPSSKLENAILSGAVFWFAVMIAIACYFLN